MINIRMIEAGPFDSNIYLLTENNTRVLIDCGSGFHNHSVEKEIRDGLKGEPLDGIILTHEHFDHSGGASYLARVFDAPLHASAECARALRDGNDKLTGAFLFGAHMEPIMDITEIEKELKLGDARFEVISTPGHAPGLICLITKEGRNLFCGDLVFCDGGVGRWDLPGGNLEQHRRSVARARKWDVSALYPGHGRYETKNPAREIELANGMIKAV